MELELDKRRKLKNKSIKSYKDAIYTIVASCLAQLERSGVDIRGLISDTPIFTLVVGIVPSATTWPDLSVDIDWMAIVANVGDDGADYVVGSSKGRDEIAAINLKGTKIVAGLIPDNSATDADTLSELICLVADDYYAKTLEAILKQKADATIIDTSMVDKAINFKPNLKVLH